MAQEPLTGLQKLFLHRVPMNSQQCWKAKLERPHFLGFNLVKSQCDILEFLHTKKKQSLYKNTFLHGRFKDFSRCFIRTFEICKNCLIKTIFSNANPNGYLFLTNAVGILRFFFALTAGERGYFISIQKNRTLGTRGAESAVASSQILTGQETNKTFL